MSNAKTETVKIRRAPKFIPFALTGLALGAVIAIVLSLTINNPDGKTPCFITQLLVYSLAGGAGFGVVVAVVFDLLSNRRTKEAEASKVSSK
jgi:xanthine/uracil permease